MSRLPRRSLLAPLLAAAAALTLTACGNGGVAVQSKEHTVENGAGAEVGPLDVRDATLTLGGGGVALLAVALYNQSPTADALTGVSGPEGSTFTLPTTATAHHGVYSGATPSDTVTVAVTPTGAASSAHPRAKKTSTAARLHSASPTVSSSTAPASDAGATVVAIPGQTGVFLNAGLTQIVVRNLPADTRVGTSVPITFTFLGAGSVTLEVPVTAGVGVDLSGDGPMPTVSTDGAQSGPMSSTPPVVVTVTATTTVPASSAARTAP